MNPDYPFKDIGDRINAALVGAGYTKDRHKNLTDVLARTFNVSIATVSNWRHGQKCPAMENALLIAVKLDVCVEWLLTGRGPVSPFNRTGNKDLEVSTTASP